VVYGRGAMRPVRRLPPGLWTTLFVVGLAGCNLSLRSATPIPDGGADAAVTSNGVGAMCTADSGCRTGLVCAPATKTCQPPGTRAAGGACTLTAECMAGQYCSFDGVCAPRGNVPAGGKCTLEGECAAGICNYQGLSGTCAPAGMADLGGACSKATDCMGGLICSLGKCQTLETIEPWQGAVCPDQTAMAPRALFKVPRPTGTGDDFYALPFPNDIRKSNGKVSLAGHPTPGARYLPFDPVKGYFSLVEQDLAGFGLNPGVFFRFSRNPGVDSVRKPGAVSLVNITPGSPEYGKAHAILTPELRTGKSYYVCAPYLIVHSKWGDPLRAGETYAAVVRREVTDESSLPFDRDDDFLALLSSTPQSGDLATAWAAYAPLRAWLSDQKVAADTILTAAVFTTQKVEEPITGLRRAVREGAAPEVKGVVKCGDPGVKSPCDDGKTGDAHARGCSPPSASYDEYQGTVAIPVFQTGTKPYEMEGGGIQFDATGKATSVGSEDVCFTLTVPKGAAPATGWPLVVYAHGTGGSYRSVVDQGLSEDYAKGELPAGAAQPMATLGYDGALHANRRGGSERSPDELVYNFVNARAARDNGLQAAADLFVIARAMETFSTVKVDAAKLMLYGHSQGGNAAALAAPYEPLFGTTVMSGTGGTLTFSLLAKKKPVDIAAGVPLLLGDPKVDELHPILNVLQMYFERSDAVNFGRRLFSEPPAGVNARSVLHIYGTADTYAPVLTQQTYALAAGFPVLSPPVEDFMLMRVPPPVKGNITVGAGTITALEAQFTPTSGDGHFVSTSHPVARRYIQQMLGTFAREGQPTVGP
jgi:predicted esterase